MGENLILGIIVALALLGVIAFHFPFRGTSVRDRFRYSSERCRTITLRLISSSGVPVKLTRAQILQLVLDCPISITGVQFYHFHPHQAGELAHRYRSYCADQHIAPPRWLHVQIQLPPEQDPKLVATFMAHRFAQLGINARRVSTVAEGTKGTQAELLALRRPPGRDHVHRPYLWFGGCKTLIVAAAPQQLLGVTTSSQPVAVSLLYYRRWYFSGDEAALIDLLIAAATCGYSIGLRTSRPQYFRTALTAGVSLIGQPGEREFDLIVLDRASDSRTLYGDTSAGTSTNTNTNTSTNTEKMDQWEALIAHCPPAASYLLVGECDALGYQLARVSSVVKLHCTPLIWELQPVTHASAEPTALRPLPLQIAARIAS